MSVATRLLGFVTTLGLIFGAAWWAGTLTAVPGGLLPPAAPDVHALDLRPDRAFEVEATGLVSAAAGYTVVPRGPTTFEPGVPAEFAFVITGAGGRPVTAFDVKEDRLLDLIVVRRDGTEFQHVQPVVGPGGVWRAPLHLPHAGVYRAYVDFVPTGGPALVLGVDLSVSGRYVPEALRTSRTAHVDGYDVRLDADLVAGTRSEVFVAIDRDRLPVTDLESHLGPLGHLVVVRQSDMTYLRVTPLAPEPASVGTHRAGPGPAFTIEVPAVGVHRLFLEFKHQGAVHTAEFTVTTGSAQ